jgi:hypothetical protein
MLAVRETDRPHEGSLVSRVVARLPTLVHAEWFGYVFGVAAVVLVTVVLEELLPTTRLGTRPPSTRSPSW